MEYKKLDELLEYIQPTKYIVDSENYDDSFPTPVLTAGKSFILGYTDETNGIYFASKENPIILFDDFTTECKLVDFAFKVKSSACKILKPKKDINIKYVYYAMKNIDIDTALHKRYWISIYSQQTIPFPSPIIQENIVSEIEVIKEIIEYNEHKIKCLEELIKSQFIEMFENKGFPEKKGSELFKFTSGKFLIAEKRLDEGIPVYGGNGIACYTDDSLIDFDTIVIGRVGAYCGNARLVKGPKWITDNALYISKFKTNDFMLEFLNELMTLHDFHQYAGAAAQPKITQKPLENQMYIIPPMELQIEFTNFVQQIDKSKFIVQKEIKLLEELLEVKMNEYFS